MKRLQLVLLLCVGLALTACDADVEVHDATTSADTVGGMLDSSPMPQHTDTSASDPAASESDASPADLTLVGCPTALTLIEGGDGTAMSDSVNASVTFRASAPIAASVALELLSDSSLAFTNGARTISVASGSRLASHRVAVPFRVMRPKGVASKGTVDIQVTVTNVHFTREQTSVRKRIKLTYAQPIAHHGH